MRNGWELYSVATGHIVTITTKARAAASVANSGGRLAMRKGY